MVSLIYVALKAMGSFSAAIYLLEVSILLNIAKLIFSGLNVLAQLQTMKSRNLPVHTN